jgi:Fic family protein
MDISHFGSQATGELVQFEGKDYAFVPHPLPPSWSFPASLWPLLAQAREKVALLEGVGRTLPNPTILLQPLSRREAIQSSRLEGTYASPRELLLYEMEPREARPGESREQDWREVYNYRKAITHTVTSELPLSLRLIRDTHKILLTGVRGEKAPGEFRRVNVAIGANRRFVPPPVERLAGCLDAFEKAMHVTVYDPLVECFLIHYQFETIHPFMDGNGRIGRVLLAAMIQKRCGLTKPWLYLSEFLERHRDEYFQRLFDVSAAGAWESWVEFCLRGTTECAAATVERCEKLLTIREGYGRKLKDAGGHVRLNQIIENLFHSPYVRPADVASELKVTYPTAKADLERLCKAGILKPLANASPKTYYAPEVFEATYADLEDRAPPPDAAT